MNLRYRFPEEFRAEALGKMIGQIWSTDSGRPLSKLRPVLKELEEVNDYCTKYSHGDEALIKAERILASDLKSILEMALSISRGYPTSDGR